MSDAIPTATGIVFRSSIAELREKAAAEYRGMLEPLISKGKGKGGLTKEKLADLLAGFDDGMTALLTGLQARGVIVVVNDPDAPAPATSAGAS